MADEREVTDEDRELFWDIFILTFRSEDEGATEDNEVNSECAAASASHPPSD
ncbi:hypothetical protein RvY_11884 [Ramazzottius varieornatus]|uniref:Uncharacterized protein n=1 Tax=Ramazzottius varieornatus TaxID=947166 RepID=A0A1D1VHJ8_RAMVA|nr:hypothetical protein RvY_11884 [Ramazzottius varieornatus]